MNIVEQYRPERLPLAQACDALIIHRSSVYARRIAATAKPKDDARCRQHAPQPRALTPEENTQVLSTLRSERFKDQPPAQIYYQLMQGGEYLCSISTMHRRLREHGENGERRNQRPAQHHAVPQLVAQNPNEVWSWDITKLPLMQRGVFLSLYVVIDLYSRFVIAWMLSRKENSALAQQLMSEAIDRYPEAAGKLAIHQDRGSPMIAQGFLDTLGDLGATATHNRPRVSNDNPFSESQFKTLKYQPDYPGRFESYAHAEHWCAEYFDWYNNDHHHSSLAGFTPEQVFSGRYRELAKEREKTMRAAYERNPERFVKGPPKVALPPQVVAINPIYREDGSIETESGVNLPTLPKVREANLH